MKKTLIYLFMMTVVLNLASCRKDISTTNAQLVATKSLAIKIGEPVVFTLKSAPVSAVTWSVIPNTNVKINADGNSASVLFGISGKYSVLANSGQIIVEKSVAVQDSIYNGNSGSICVTIVPLTGDQITLTPTIIDSMNISGLIIYALTANNYECLNNNIISNVTQRGSDYQINFLGISGPGASNCTGGQAKAAGFIFLYPVTDGAHSIQFLLNDTTYSGSFIKSGNKFTFTWPYITGVKLSSLIIQK